MSLGLSSIKRCLSVDLQDHNLAFLWGPRQTGKTILLHDLFPNAWFIDLLKTDTRTEYSIKPHLLREKLLTRLPELVVIDEIQKVPALLDEVHWLSENTPIRFILSGSSARKVKRGAANLLGGRAWSFSLMPLTTVEIGEVDLERAFNHGLLPRHYLMDKPERSLRAYLNEYLSVEIQAEAVTRNVPAFARFLDAVAATHGHLVNYANISNEAGVTAQTVKEYYQILKDTLIGYDLEPWRKSAKRRLIETAKFYLFDPGLVRVLKGLPPISKGTEDFGRYFEHFLIGEVRAYLSYREKTQKMRFWRTSTGFEVDLIVGDMEMAVECKAKENPSERDIRGLATLREEHRVGNALLVCLAREERVMDGIRIMPWRKFCAGLWAGKWV